MLGLLPFEGALQVLGRSPWAALGALMRDVCFTADLAVPPLWIRVDQALEYVAGVHPRFDRAKAEHFLVKAGVRHGSKVRELSKGLAAQVHLAIVMAIDAKMLVLDQPTLGLDLLASKQFYDSLIHDYFDRSGTIVVSTHQIDELQDVLTDFVFLDRGRIVLECDMETYESRYFEVMVRPDRTDATRARPDPRTPGVRPRHPAVRPRGAGAARRAGRRSPSSSRYCSGRSTSRTCSSPRPRRSSRDPVRSC